MFGGNKYVKIANKFFNEGVKPTKLPERYPTINLTDNFFLALEQLKLHRESAKKFDEQKLVQSCFEQIEKALQKHLDEFDKLKKKYILIGDFCNYVVLAHQAHEKLQNCVEDWQELVDYETSDLFEKRLRKAEQQLLEKANTYFEEKNYLTADTYFESANKIGLLDENLQKTYYTAKKNTHYRNGGYFMKRGEIETSMKEYKIALGMGYPCLKEYRDASEKCCVKVAEKLEDDAIFATLPKNKAKLYAMAQKTYEEAKRLSTNPSKYDQKIAQMQQLHNEKRDAVKNFFKELGTSLGDALLEIIFDSSTGKDVIYEETEIVTETEYDPVFNIETETETTTITYKKYKE